MQGKVQGRGLKQTLTNENGNVTPIYPNDKLGDRAFKPAGGLFYKVRRVVVMETEKQLK